MKNVIVVLFCVIFTSCSSSINPTFTKINSIQKKVPAIKEKQLVIPAILGSNEYNLEAKLYFPDDNVTNHPIALITHGRNGPEPKRNENQVNSLAILNRTLAYQGYVSLFIVRRGYGNSEGPDSEFLDTPEESGLAGAQDIQAIINYLQNTDIGDSSKIVIIGQSQGGWVALASSTMDLPGVLGAVNISGAINFKQARGFIFLDGVEKPLERSAAFFGEKNKVPVFWLYAANDNHSINSVSRWFTAFTLAGGKGTLFFTPKYKPHYNLNGHSVVNRPDYYFAELSAFFTDIGFTE
jgi:dienelactone hydrolase